MHNPPFLAIVGALAAMGVGIVAGCYTNPVTGRQSMVLISQGQELSLGASSFDDIRKKEKVSTDATMNARVQRVGQRIAEAVGNQMPNAQWEFVVFDSKEINAFALPGGKVGVYTGLLQMVSSDDELAVVMGHEIGHVIARHGAERMSESMVIAGLGVVGALAVENNYDAQTRNLFLLAYGGATTLGRVLPQSRSNESEADRMGAVYAARAGYDPRAAITFWRKMEQAKPAGSGQVPAWISTHPSDRKRIVDLETSMPQMLPIYEANRHRF